MNGIEKIIGHIIADAQTAAEQAVRAGNAVAEDILEKYSARAEDIRAKYIDSARREADGMISRAAASGGNVKRDMLLEAKSSLIDSAFRGAVEYFKNLSADEYTDCMSALLCSVLKKNIEVEKVLAAQYKDEFISVNSYTLTFNERDTEKTADKIIASAAAVLSDNGKTLEKSGRTADIDGGFILTAGDVESNCSLELMIYSLRDTLEGDISNTLFKD